MTLSTKTDPWLRGDWMQTNSGKRFYPLDPQLEDIDSADIAHALSLLCRYGGHVDRFYSVAEHCVLMSQAVPPEAALQALLHDATEAFVVDVPRPLKRYLPEYQAIELRLWGVICEKYGVDAAILPDVKSADNRILLTERAMLMTKAEEQWPSLDGLAPLPVPIHAWPPAEAERQYLARLAELTS